MSEATNTQQVTSVATAGNSTSTPSEGVAHLAEATTLLLACRSAEEVFGTIGRFLLLLVPDSVVVINELSPQEDSLTTVKVYGLDS